MGFRGKVGNWGGTGQPYLVLLELGMCLTQGGSFLIQKGKRGNLGQGDNTQDRGPHSSATNEELNKKVQWWD